MKTRPNFENTGLLKAKSVQLENLVSESANIQTNSPYFCSYSFHGFILNFFSEDNSFAEKVLNFLPISWKTHKETEACDTLNIYLVNKWGADWDLEENPDCFLNRENDLETAIQRDFVGIDDNGSVIVSLEGVHGDGIFNILRWLLPRRMITKGYFLLHSSCVVSNGKASFFLGHSGAGKSTLATLSGERMVLGDDMNVMRIENGKIFARAGGLGGMSFEGTDFDNEFPVEGFYWLIQDSVDLKKPLNKSQAVSKLLASLANVFWEFMNIKEKETLLDLATTVVDASSFNELHFTKTEECWKNVI